VAQFSQISPAEKQMFCHTCPSPGEVLTILAVAIAVAIVAAWLSGSWLKSRFVEIALSVAFVLWLFRLMPKSHCGAEGCLALINSLFG
jgi:hypothetical protein